MSLLASSSLAGTEEVTEGWLYWPGSKVTKLAYHSVLQRQNTRSVTRYRPVCTHTAFLCWTFLWWIIQ